MTDLLVAPPVFRTLADLLENLGGVSAHRVLYYPRPGTEQDVLDLDAKEDRLCELVDGILVEKALGFWESVLAAAISAALDAFVFPRKLGVIAGADGMVRLFPNLNLIRIPDVSYVATERLPTAGAPHQPIPQLAPNLVVEVLSEGNTEREMRRKRGEYFDAGVQLCWIVNTKSRSIEVYTSQEQRIVLHEGDTLDGGSVLPGFSLDIAALFARLDQ